MSKYLKIGLEIAVATIIACIIIGMMVNKTVVASKNRSKGQSTFLYYVEGCNVYRISDGNGDHTALLTKCAHTDTISQTQKELDTNPGPGPFQNKEFIVSNTTER